MSEEGQTGVGHGCSRFEILPLAVLKEFAPPVLEAAQRQVDGRTTADAPLIPIGCDCPEGSFCIPGQKIFQIFPIPPLDLGEHPVGRSCRISKLPPHMSQIGAGHNAVAARIFPDDLFYGPDHAGNSLILRGTPSGVVAILKRGDQDGYDLEVPGNDVLEKYGLELNGMFPTV
jgi:hypothetical protein